MVQAAAGGATGAMLGVMASKAIACATAAHPSPAVQQATSSNTPSLQGTGEYGKVGGHHIHAKAGFKGNVNYDPKKGFSISQDFMEANGLNHQKMTNTQRKLFKELANSGRPNTLAEHTRIASEALKAGGASPEMVDSLVNES